MASGTRSINDRATAAVEKRRAFVRYLKNGPVPEITTALQTEDGTEPRVTVVIPTANTSRAHHLSRLLQQIQGQSLRSVEIVIVAGDRRQGRAINTAAAIARGDILVTMDDDTQLGDPRLLEKLVAALDRDRAIGIAGVASRIPQDAPSIVRRAMRELPRRSSPVVQVVTDSDMAEHPCLAIRKALFYEIGGEHELIPRGLDPYLRREVRRRGYRVVVIPDAWIYHLLPPTYQAILRQYFRNGHGAAYVKKFHPECVIDLAEDHGREVADRTSLPGRTLRYSWRMLRAIASAKWVYLGTLLSYAAGYTWGMMTLRRDAL